MDKRYNINEVELKSQLIDVLSSRDKIGEYFTIILPPPNVTGSLHIGHALNSTLQDIVVRYKKMLGYDVLWQPGTDHAGIATQMVVERDLLKKGIYKDKIGRNEFVSKVWEWKEKSNNIILDQLAKLGCLCDWDRSRFTMDLQSSEAVIEAFIDLYEKKLIYKSKRLVNWDCVLQTAISDLEVDKKDLPGKLYYIRYPIVKKDQLLDVFAEIDWNKFVKNNQFLVVATTRPETLFGDVAIALNPKDQRLEQLNDYQVLVPETKKFIPIIADDYVDLDYGSGLVKITPGHDFNDYEVGKRHNLTPVNILNVDGTLNCEVPEKYQRLDRFAARQIQ
ncbi:valine--tRNA ligase-like [Triplophysa rosa]|uniref:valine--tRNA ligase-like n=1 Tax=Triplophysa rosa TaxID=992332 RepID=UPI002546341E|nr:valine--tRNA ligase-like [Triplophysa rosa]